MFQSVIKKEHVDEMGSEKTGSGMSRPEVVGVYNHLYTDSGSYIMWAWLRGSRPLLLFEQQSVACLIKCKIFYLKIGGG